MPLKTATKLSAYSGGRHSIYLPNKFVADSQFPFQPGDDLVVVISNGELVVRRARKT